MNNSVVIEYTPLSAIPKILLNGDELTQYSELHGSVNKPIYMWINEAVRHFDEHFNDTYSLSIIGTNFQQRIASHCAKQSKYCFSVLPKPMKMLSDIDYKLTVVKKIASHRGVSLRDIDKSVGINADGLDGVAEYLPEGFSIHAIANAAIRLCNSRETAVDAHEPLRIYPAEELTVQIEGADCYLSLPKTDIKDFISDLWLYEQAIPYINNAHAILSSLSLGKVERAALDSAVNEKVNYIYDPLPSEMDVGEEFRFAYGIFPEQLANKFIKVVSSDENVVVYENGNIRGVKQGISSIRLIGIDDVLIESFDVQIVKRNYIQSIQIIAPFEALCVDDSAKLQIFTYPENADDEAELTLSISNPEVAIAQKNGEVVAFKPGTCVLTVSSSQAETKFNIIVKPKLNNLQLSLRSANIIRKQSIQIRCSSEPADAYVGNLEWGVDKDSIVTVSVSQDKKSCSVYAEKVGSCVISCTDERTQKSSSCSIQVIQEETHTVLEVFTIITTVLGIIFSFWIPAMAASMKSFGGAFAGLLFDFCLPTSMILAAIGKNKAGDKVKTFSICLTLGWVTLAIMLFIALIVS